jgi:hypothetical protein
MNESSPLSGARVSIALLHHPVYDKNQQVVTTAVTNLDIHDIARAARTFGLFRYYLVTPVAEQQQLVTRITRHWQDGWGAAYNPKRKAALDLVRLAPSLQVATSELTEQFGMAPRVVVTGARGGDSPLTCRQLAAQLEQQREPLLLVFGTGWGLTAEVFRQADATLEPISGPTTYNHLSVRSAVAIYLDRLFGGRAG